VDRREEEKENQQRKERGWVLKGKHGSTGRRIRESARSGTERGGGAGESARAAWRPFRASARRGGRGDGQRVYCKRWEEAQRDAWSGAQRAQCGGRGSCTGDGSEGKQENRAEEAVAPGRRRGRN
jgi:hypothetical protein